MQVQYSSDHKFVCSQPGMGISSQNFEPNRVKALVCAMARAIFTPSTSTWNMKPALDCTWNCHSNLDILWVGEISGIENRLIIRIGTSEHDTSTRLGSQKHWYDWPSVSVGKWSVHLPHCIRYTMCLTDWQIMFQVFAMQTEVIKSTMMNSPFWFVFPHLMLDCRTQNETQYQENLCFDL